MGEMGTWICLFFSLRNGNRVTWIGNQKHGLGWEIGCKPRPFAGWGGGGGGTSSFEHLNRVLLTLECTQGHKPLVI